jgi:formate dehydrogenase major subunit/formate dehydrogenase alpha subunit
MSEIAALTPSYAGVSFKRLETCERMQWPVAADGPGTPILHVGRFTRGQGRFHAVDHLPPQELPDDQYPLLLTTGRVLYHWHGGEMTRRVPALMEVFGQPLLEVSPEDARRFGILDGQPVLVASRRGEMQAYAVVTQRVGEGIVFGNFHFPDEQNVNNLTICALDPVAKIPEYKVCAVRVVPDERRGRKIG